jgi:hypothetical protein
MAFFDFFLYKVQFNLYIRLLTFKIPAYGEVSCTTGCRSAEFSFTTFGFAADRLVAVCLSVRPQSFPNFFQQCVQLLHWNFVSGFISRTYRSSSKMVAIDQLLEELCSINLPIFEGFYSFTNFFRNVSSYCIETLYVALYPWLTDQVRRLLLSTNFWKSDAPWI